MHSNDNSFAPQSGFLMKRPLFSPFFARSALAYGVIALAGCASNPPNTPPASPDAALPAELKVGQEQHLDDVYVTLGDEVWRCSRGAAMPSSADAPAGPTLQWVQVGSEGTLVDKTRHNIGTVMPGGRFSAYDGSSVEATLTRQSQVSANTLTWALYRVKHDENASGTATEGRFARLSSIVRTETVGGMPLGSECANEGMQLLVPYTATYMLYRASAAE